MNQNITYKSPPKTIYTTIKQVLKAIPKFKLRIKQAEIYLKKIEIEKDFKEE